MKIKSVATFLGLLMIAAQARGGDQGEGFSLRNQTECRTFSGLTPVAMEGDQAPGFPGGACFTRAGGKQPAFRSVRVNSSGQVAFFASIPGHGSGIWTGRPGDLKLVVRSGDGKGFKPSPQSFHFDDKGQVTFFVQSQKEIAGLWRFDGSELRQLVFQKPKAKRKKRKKKSTVRELPGNAPCIETKAPFVLGRQGEIAIRATTPGPKAGNAIWHGTGDDLEPVVAIGDPAPGMPGSGVVFTDLFPLITKGEYVLFKAALSGPGIGRSDYHGLWIHGSEGIRLVALLDCRAFAEVASTSFTDAVTGAASCPAALNADGVVAFVGRTSGHERGLWVGQAGVCRVACRKDGTKVTGYVKDFERLILLLHDNGGLLVNRGVEILHGQPDSLAVVPTMPRIPAVSMVPRMLRGYFVSAGGLLAANAALRDGHSSAWIGRPDDMRLILRAGDAVILPSGDRREIARNGIDLRGPLHCLYDGDSLGLVVANDQTALNDAGALAVRLTFAAVPGKHDMEQGLFLLDVKDVLAEIENSVSIDATSENTKDVQFPWESNGG